MDEEQRILDFMSEYPETAPLAAAFSVVCRMIWDRAYNAGWDEGYTDGMDDAKIISGEQGGKA